MENFTPWFKKDFKKKSFDGAHFHCAMYFYILIMNQTITKNQLLFIFIILQLNFCLIVHTKQFDKETIMNIKHLYVKHDNVGSSNQIHM